MAFIYSPQADLVQLGFICPGSAIGRNLCLDPACLPMAALENLSGLTIND